MKNNQKGFIVPLLIAVIALLVIGGGAYYFFQQKKAVCWPYCPGMTDQDREDIKKSALEAQNNSTSTKPSVAVLSPNGGEVYKTGSQVNISYSLKNIPAGDQVDLIIVKGNEPSTQRAIIVHKAVNDFSETYLWKIPTIYDSGNDYRVLIMSYSVKSSDQGWEGQVLETARDSSDNYFTITK